MKTYLLVVLLALAACGSKKDKAPASGSASAVATPAEGKLDVEVFVPGYTTLDETGQIAFVMLDHTIGEYDMETKIGGIDFAAIDKAPANAKPLTELPAVVDALK